MIFEGRADAVDDLGEFFVLPEDRQMSFSNFVEKLGDVNEFVHLNLSLYMTYIILLCESEDEILYIQTQNGCMTSEFEELTSDIDLNFNFVTSLIAPLLPTRFSVAQMKHCAVHKYNLHFCLQDSRCP